MREGWWGNRDRRDMLEKGKHEEKGCWETRESCLWREVGQLTKEVCVPWVLLHCQCWVAFEGLKKGSGWPDLFPRKSYCGKMCIQANLSEESKDPSKTFNISEHWAKFVVFSSPLWCVWIVEIFQGKLEEVGGQSDAWTAKCHLSHSDLL